MTRDPKPEQRSIQLRASAHPDPECPSSSQTGRPAYTEAFCKTDNRIGPGQPQPALLDQALDLVGDEHGVDQALLVVPAKYSVLVAKTLRSLARSRAALHLEVLALRHQLQVLERSRPQRLTLTRADRLLWVWVSRLWKDWRRGLVIVKPDTVIRWHRKGFRLLWTWKSRRRLGRPTVSPDVRILIRTMSDANPLWGAPRIHGELLKLGIAISQASVAKYMIRRRPPSPTWRTFLANHMTQLTAADFLCPPPRTGSCSCW